MLPAGRINGMNLPGNVQCTACGALLRCGMVAGDATCWCHDLPHVIAVPSALKIDESAQKAGCLCPSCLKKLVDNA